MEVQREKDATEADKARFAAIGGEPLAGSGFEEETPEPGYSEAETSGPEEPQNPL